MLCLSINAETVPCRQFDNKTNDVVTFDIRDYGAVGDGKTKNTEAFRKAIAECAKAGGGKVLIPKGVWLTGKIHLKSNINLHVAEGAEVRFSQNPADYLPLVFTRGSVK